MAISAGRSGASWEEALWDEVLALGLCLFDLHLAPVSVQERTAFLGRLRDGCGRIQSGRAWRRRSGWRAPALPRGGAEVAGGVPALCEYQERARRRLTADRFAEFQRITGLEANVLVGGGGNLAALVFYLAVYGVAADGSPLARERCLTLLRASKECAADLEKAVRSWLGRAADRAQLPLHSRTAKEAVRISRAAS